jgi:hypothetical protein
VPEAVTVPALYINALSACLLGILSSLSWLIIISPVDSRGAILYADARDLIAFAVP